MLGTSIYSAFLLYVAGTLTVFQEQNPWPGFAWPTEGDGASYGSYSKGCLAGGRALPACGKGFQFTRLSRNRNWGNPWTIRYLEKFAARVHDAEGKQLMIGDISQPRGGPMSSDHASHQIGLDIDIWFWHDSKSEYQCLSEEEKEASEPPSLVKLFGEKGSKDRYVAVNPETWDDRYIDKLRQAVRTHPDSDDPKKHAVARIFVNPAIKQHLCQKLSDDEKKEWLWRIRSWWGHDQHFHVRLYCPPGEAGCKNQKETSKDPGCDGAGLKWWLKKNTEAFIAKEKAQDEGVSDEPSPQPLKTLPPICQEVQKMKAWQP